MARMRPATELSIDELMKFYRSRLLLTAPPLPSEDDPLATYFAMELRNVEILEQELFVRLNAGKAAIDKLDEYRKAGIIE